MTPTEVKRELIATEARIIGLKKDGKRRFGVQEGPGWGHAELEQLSQLRRFAKQYRALLNQHGGQ